MATTIDVALLKQASAKDYVDCLKNAVRPGLSCFQPWQVALFG